MKRAVLYSRVSSDDQREGLSLDAQTRLLENYAKKNELKIVRKFIATESAKAPGRKAFGEMVEYTKKNDVPHILVEKTDRLYRNTNDYVTILELGAKVHLVGENQILDDEDFDGTFMHEIQIALAKRFIGNLRKESLKGMREKALQGHYPGRGPLGYLNDTQRKIIIVDKEKAPLIKETFELYSTGNYSLKRLKDIMHRKGLRGRNGAFITKRAIETILQNHFYVGRFTFEGKTYQGKHKQIISKILFSEVQKQLKNRGKIVPKGKYDFPFKGIAKCGYCGCNLTAEIKKGRYVYYRCTQARGKCKLNYFREEKLAKIFQEAIDNVQLSEEVIEWLKEAIKESKKEQQDFTNNELQRLRIEYAKCERKKEQIYEDRIDGRFKENFLEGQFNKVELRQAEILEDIEKLKSKKHHFSKDEEEILELINSLENQYVTANFENKAKMLRIILSNSVLTNEKCLFSYRKPFDALAEFGKMELSSATGIRTRV